MLVRASLASVLAILALACDGGGQGDKSETERFGLKLETQGDLPPVEVAVGVTPPPESSTDPFAQATAKLVADALGPCTSDTGKSALDTPVKVDMVAKDGRIVSTSAQSSGAMGSCLADGMAEQPFEPAKGPKKTLHLLLRRASSGG